MTDLASHSARVQHCTHLWATPGVATRGLPWSEHAHDSSSAPSTPRTQQPQSLIAPTQQAAILPASLSLSLSHPQCFIQHRPTVCCSHMHTDQTLHICPSTLHSRTRRSSAVVYTGCRGVLGTAAKACGCREALLMGNHTAPQRT